MCKSTRKVATCREANNYQSQEMPILVKESIYIQQSEEKGRFFVKFTKPDFSSRSCIRMLRHNEWYDLGLFHYMRFKFEKENAIRPSYTSQPHSEIKDARKGRNGEMHAAATDRPTLTRQENNNRGFSRKDFPEKDELFHLFCLPNFLLFPLAAVTVTEWPVATRTASAGSKSTVSLLQYSHSILYILHVQYAGYSVCTKYFIYCMYSILDILYVKDTVYTACTVRGEICMHSLSNYGFELLILTQIINKVQC